MKAKDLLHCFCYENVSFESGIDYITIDEYFDFETFFGAKPSISVPFGDYVYMWSDVLENFREKMKNRILENSFLTLDVGDGYYIYLIRLDD